MVTEAWIEKAAKRISSWGYIDMPESELIDIIQQEWDAFAASCPSADSPPSVPPNPMEERVLALETQMIEIQGERQQRVATPYRNVLACSFGGGSGTFDDGQTKCSYHTRYLPNYDAKHCGELLDHSAFHAAEGCREAIHAQIKAWVDAHPNQTVPEHLQKRADYWEARSAF